jgi:hypothetical protein
MVQGSDSALYGTTYMGGASADPYNNGYGTVFRFVLPPIIFHQPTNQTVDAGGEAAFSVGSTGFGPLTYQWRKNGGDIPGATESSFSLTNVSAATAGNYSVAVSNPGGDVESSNATLTVVCPMITLGPTTFPTVTVGTGFNQTIIGIGGAEPYTFGLTGGRLPPGLSLSRSGVLSGTPTNIGNYSFTVKATDLHFCTGTISYNLAVGISFVSSFVDSNGWFSARVLVPVGASVIILESTNVSQPLSSWTPITTNSAPTGFFDFTDKTNSSLTNNWPRRFYRARFSP